MDENTRPNHYVVVMFVFSGKIMILRSSVQEG